MKIKASNIILKMGEKQILNNVTLAVQSGSSVALTGESGSGKTTLLNCLGLLVPVSHGTIEIDDTNMTRFNSRARSKFWRKDAAFIFQDYGLIDDETVGFNVCMASSPLLKRKTWGPRVHQALTAVGLDNRANEPVSRLSGGERQRIGIARAIYKQAQIIFADEPTASLDDRNRQLIQDLLLAETQRGTTIIIATHDHTLAQACDTIFQLQTT